MKNFKSGNKGSKRADFGDNRGSRPGMHQAICSECGQPCEVPFRPTGDRPVFCTACFAKRGQSGANRPGGRDRQRSGFDNKRMFEAVCAKCGKTCEVPFRPSGDKPVYCSQCFDKGGKPSGQTATQSNQQFDILNAKLDKILQALGPAALAGAKAKKPAAVKKTKTAKKAKTKKK